jgi:hypothetical protein
MDEEQIGGRIGWGTAAGITRRAAAAGRGLKGRARSYASRAREYVPRMPSMPDMPDMPGMPDLPGSGKLKWAMAIMAVLTAVGGVLALGFSTNTFGKKWGFKNMEPFKDTMQRGPQKVSDNPDVSHLTNLQLLTTRVPPPLQDSNRVSTDTAKTAIQGYISDCLNTGSRTFFLDIDFNVHLGSAPMLIYRKGNDMVPNNYCHIGDVMSQLQTIGFSNGVQNNKAPIIIILHLARTPITDPIRNTGDYNKYLDHIANALKPYEGSMLAQTPIGDFRYHQKESVLISTPITEPNFAKKFIVLCNANVSLYNPDEIGNTHLNHYVHLRYFLDDPNQQKVGITLPPIMIDPPSATIAMAASLANLNSTASQSWVAGHSNVFTIALPMTTSTISDENMLPLLQMGINCIPTYIADKKPTGYWGAGTPWVIVPPAMQNSPPPPS